MKKIYIKVLVLTAILVFALFAGSCNQGRTDIILPQTVTDAPQFEETDKTLYDTPQDMREDK